MTDPTDAKPGDTAKVLPLGHAYVQRERTSFVALIPNEAKGRSCAICSRPASEHANG